MFEPLPVWLCFWVTHALLGEVYPEIRAIAVGWNKEKTFFIRYYVDREVDDYDYESIDIVITYILANTSSNDEIVKVVDDVVFDLRSLNDVDKLSGFIYMRREC